jgi:carboxyl-terminal processing protease
MSDFDSPPRGIRRFLKVKPSWVWFVSLFCTLVLALALVPSVLIAQTNPTPKPNAANDASSMATFQEVYRYMMTYYVDQPNPDSLMEGAIAGMLASVKDPYTVYLAQSDMREMTDTTSGDFVGIGAYIEKERNKDGSNKDDGNIVIAAPIEGTPAWKADLRSNDRILKVDSDDTTQFSIDEGVKHLRGKPGSKVTLLIGRGTLAPFTVTLTREKIEVPTIRSAMIGDIAYVKIITFTPHTGDRMEEVLKQLVGKATKGLIIDVRNNPGGVLDAPIQIADMFLDDGPIVSTKGRISSEDYVAMATPGTIVPPDLPVFMLVNGSSASASEILSGALKDRGRALLVGEKTYGKGLVQRVITLPPGNRGFKLTTARYYTPSGNFIDKKGIQPDYEVKEPAVTEAEEKTLLQIRDKGSVEAFVKTTPNPTLDQIKAFGVQLKAAGMELPERYVYRLVKREADRANNTEEVYDLNYDEPLKKALELIPSWTSIRKPPILASDLPQPVAPKTPAAN